MHWVDQAAEELLKKGKEHVIASGTSISGHIHIGHCNDVFIADAVRRAVEGKGGKAVTIWYADDFDPLRRVPAYLPPGYEKFLGMPYANLPSPEPGFENFVDYFARPFLQSLDAFGIKVQVYYGSKVYKSGQLSPLIRLALERADTIRCILNRFREKPLPENWLPYDPVCSKCGRIATTEAYDWQGNWVFYRCLGCEYTKGCGNEDQADYTKGEGKLTWRVEWPARWKMLGVTCEPFGKDHAEAGGSYETGKLIIREVFGGEPPYPIPYEWVSLSGERMSSSKGVVFTLPDWLRVAEPELLRFFIFRSKPMKAKNFDPGPYLLNLYDEFDELERSYFEGRAGERARIYELSLTGPPGTTPPQRLPIRFSVVLCQVAKDRKHAEEIILSRGLMRNPTPQDMEAAFRRLKLAEEWVRKYAPEELRVSLQEFPPPPGTFGEKELRALKRLAERVERVEWSPVQVHNLVYEVAREESLEPSLLFEALYLLFLGRRSGPRVGNLLAALDRGFVLERIRAVTKGT
ncbi:MAG: lysine--tRNA ligase [Candidatus Hadarchaeales archaeon]